LDFILEAFAVVVMEEEEDPVAFAAAEAAGCADNFAKNNLWQSPGKRERLKLTKN